MTMLCGGIKVVFQFVSRGFYALTKPFIYNAEDYRGVHLATLRFNVIALWDEGHLKLWCLRARVPARPTC